MGFGITTPSLRYLTHLVEPGWNVIGAGEPGVPGVAAGHNERVGFGFTIVGMDQQQDVSVIKAMVPLSEMLNYSTELRSITAGEGDYSYQLDHYDVVPSHIASELVAKHKRELEAAHT